MYGEGISKEGNILDVAVAAGIIEKSGAWFSYNKEKLGQGRDNVRKYMIQNPEFTKEIENLVRQKLKDGFVYKVSKNTEKK